MGDESKQSELSAHSPKQTPQSPGQRSSRALSLRQSHSPCAFPHRFASVFELDVVQFAAHCFPNQPVIKHIAQHPFMAFPIVGSSVQAADTVLLPRGDQRFEIRVFGDSIRRAATFRKHRLSGHNPLKGETTPVFRAQLRYGLYLRPDPFR